ncbi:Uncharacterised protein [Vibrio cholerae]|uniref:Uncharacterized protein n=1 Tax=Vibrio cholerae TaxID=666 RepID=A0A655ZX43_VIBCL|nr:Uncharacterised protein [Vibrio cholerae]CSC86986.1 Uncharacterised protein [Vibrio cholerae]
MLVNHRVNQGLHIPFHHFGQAIYRQIDTVIGHSTLRVVISANAVTTIA